MVGRGLDLPELGEGVADTSSTSLEAPRLLYLDFPSSHGTSMLATQLLTTTSTDPGPYSPWAPAHFSPSPVFMPPPSLVRAASWH